jgi:mRNA interferase RelE/StbE
VKVIFRPSFGRDLRKIKDAAILSRLEMLIEELEMAQSLQQIEHTKKLHTGTNCYRIRVGDYRIGLLLEEDEIIFVRCLNRRDLYKFFP